MQTRRQVLLASVVLVFLYSCAHIVLTPKQTVLWAANVYNAQYDLYVKQAQRADLTEDEKEVMRMKKELLSDLEQAIQLAEAAVKAGIDPDTETQENLVYLINRLLEDL